MSLQTDRKGPQSGTISALALGPCLLLWLLSWLLPRHLGRVGSRRLGCRLRDGILRFAARRQLLAQTVQQ